jgi:hypothetical protein
MSDAGRLTVDFGEPEDGWLTVTINQNDKELRFFPSHVPYDSVTELAQALLKIFDGYEEAIARWNDEPVGYEFRFNRDGGRAKFIVYALTTSVAGSVREEVFASHGSDYEVLRPFWKALRDLESRQGLEEYRKQWREPFPKREVEELTERVKALKARERR